MGFHKTLRGSDLHSPSNELVENNSGLTISKMTCVTFNTIGSKYPSISAANGLTDIIRGITQTDIATSGTGYVTSLGFMTQVNTSTWNAGTILYCSSSGALTTLSSGLPIATVLRKDSVYGVLYVNALGVTQTDIANATFPAQAELEMTWSASFPTPYKEFSYNGTGDIVDYDVYTDNTKTVKIFNKHFSYDIDGNLIQIVTTNLLNMLTKTKTITYDGLGEMTSMQES